MNFGDLKAELAARGFDALSSARRGQVINDAIAELDEYALWPYREASVTGTAPLTVADLGVIEMVINTDESNRSLQPASYASLVNWHGDVSTSGTPACYYVAWPSGVPVVATYPVSSDTIGVQYWRVTPELAADADVPVAPSRYHRLYLLIAQRMAESERGNLDVAGGLQQEIDRQLARMVDALFDGQTVQGPSDYQSITFASEDW